MNRLAVGVALALVAQSQAAFAGIQHPDTPARNPPGRSSADRLERLRHSCGDGAHHRRQGRRRHLASCAADHRVPAMAAHRGKGPAIPHRGKDRLRRGQPVRVRPRVRSASRQHHQDSRAARFVHAVGHDLGLHRLVSRPAHRLRVRRERRRREDRPGDLRRRKRGQRVGWRLGRRDADRLARLDGRVPDPAITTALRSREEPHFRLHDRPRHLSLLRASELADLPPVEDRLRVAIRLARRARRSRGAAPARGDAVRRHKERGEHRRRTATRRAPRQRSAAISSIASHRTSRSTRRSIPTSGRSSPTRPCSTCRRTSPSSTSAGRSSSPAAGCSASTSTAAPSTAAARGSTTAGESAAHRNWPARTATPFRSRRRRSSAPRSCSGDSRADSRSACSTRRRSARRVPATRPTNRRRTTLSRG